MAKPAKNVQGTNAFIGSDWIHKAYRDGMNGHASYTANVPAQYKAAYDTIYADALYQRMIMGRTRNTI
jgi:hypothetical protein